MRIKSSARHIAPRNWRLFVSRKVVLTNSPATALLNCHKSTNNCSFISCYFRMMTSNLNSARYRRDSGFEASAYVRQAEGCRRFLFLHGLMRHRTAGSCIALSKSQRTVIERSWSSSRNFVKMRYHVHRQVKLVQIPCSRAKSHVAGRACGIHTTSSTLNGIDNRGARYSNPRTKSTKMSRNPLLWLAA